MERLSTLAHAQLEAEAGVELAESNLRVAKERLRVVAEVTIPEVMEELGLETFKTSDGLSIAVPETIRANITEANRASAFGWLRGHGHGRLIKDKFEVLANDEGQAERLQGLFVQFSEEERAVRNTALAYKENPSIHPQTLGKFVREALENGIELPDTIGIFRQRVSKVSVK